MKRLMISVISILLLTFFIGCDFNNSTGAKNQENQNTENKTTENQVKNWVEVSSLKEAFVDGGYFDRFGLACEYKEISNSSIRAGLAHHVNLHLEMN